jgi:mono/diheme cytochrome c family protein
MLRLAVRRWTISHRRIPQLAAALLGVTMVTAPRSSAAQSQPPRSTMAGVYTAGQAARGQQVFSGICMGCHTVASYTNATFIMTWSGRPLSDLLGFIRNRMPKNDPGSLTVEEYTDVLTYLLKLNSLPAGNGELPADSVAMAAIKIELPSARPTKDR